MAEFAFVLSLPDGDNVEYRTSGDGLTATEAVERCRGKFPEASIENVLQGDLSDVDFDTTHRNDSESTGSARVADTPPFQPSDMTVSELRAELDADMDKPNLRALLVAEKGAKNRTTATDAIEERLDE